MKIIFFGTSDFAAQILSALNDRHHILAVVTQPDQKVGRRQEIQASAVAKLAEELKLPVLKPESLRRGQIELELKNLNAEAIVVAAYGKIIPKNILELAPKGALNVHPSLLPKYRGASPIQSALLNGDAETGVTIMLMDEQMDHGPIILQETLKIQPDDNTSVLSGKLANLSQILLLKALSELGNGANGVKIKPMVQDESMATYCKIIQRADGQINWSEKNAAQVYNMYRAYHPWPGIWTMWRSQIIKLQLVPATKIEQKTEPGKVLQIEKNIFVGCADGTVEITEVQLEGKRVMTAQDFLLGHKNFIGATLGL